MSKFMHSYKFIEKKPSNKKEKGPEEIRVIFYRFHSSFSHMIFTEHFYSFVSSNVSYKCVFPPPHRQYSVEKVPPPLVIVLNDTWDKKGRNGHERVSQTGAGSDKHFCSVKLCLHNNGTQ